MVPPVNKLNLSVLVLCLSLGACATQRAAQTQEPSEETAAQTSDTDAAQDTAAMVKPGEAKVGDRTSCPVSKEAFTVAADSPSAQYDGKTYYFCCPHCAEKFQADPQKYTQQ
jgi:YHS domain-containing protein